MSKTSHIDRRRGFALALLCSAFFMVILDVAIVNVALPSIQTDLGFSPPSLQWVVSAYALTFGGLLLLGGRAADLLGRRRVFVGGVAVFALASLLGGLAWLPELLVTARALQGIGAAAMTPAALSILMTTFPEGAERNKALGAWGAVGASGGTIGLLIGGILTQTVGWEWIFLLNVPVGAAVVALSPVLLEETRDRGTVAGFDLAGAATVTAALSLLVYGIVDADQVGWGSPRSVAVAAVSAVLLAAFAVIERRSQSPLLPFHVFRLRALLASNVAGLLFGAAVFGMFFVITLYLQQVLGYSPLHAGLAWLALSVTALAASAGGARLVTAVGSRGPLVTGLGIAAVGVWLLSRLPAEAAYASDVMLPLIVSGAGIGLAFVTMSIGALEGVGDRDAGLASGLVNTTQQIGGALGVAVLSTVLLRRGFADALVVGALLAGAGALLAAVLLRAGAPRARERVRVTPRRGWSPRSPRSASPPVGRAAPLP
jgi:EmrB/QacA subfamily drug resistance transporter